MKAEEDENSGVETEADAQKQTPAENSEVSWYLS